MRRTRMSQSRSFVLGAMATTALLLFPAVCAGQGVAADKELRAKQAKKIEAYVKAAQALRAGNGRGFVCTGDSTGGACACAWGKPNVNWGCKGMDILCKRVGGRSECDDKYCFCVYVLE